MKNDINHVLSALSQSAKGAITYGVPVAGVKATGTVTIVDYLKSILTAATQTLTVSGAITPASHAVGTLTSTGVVMLDAETVTIGSTVYRFKTVMSQAYDVQLNALASISLDNLKAAINASGTPGTEYFAGTLAHPTVYATTNTDTTQALQARTPGTAANSIATTETSAFLSFGAVTLTGGVAGETATVDARTYTFVDALTETSGAAAIANQVLRGAATTNALDNLKSAINASAGVGTTFSTGTTAHATVAATTKTATTLVVAAKTSGAAGNALAATETLANGAWGAATLAGGYDNLTVTVNGTALVQGTDFTAATSNSATATALATAIAALSPITAAAVGAVVTITADNVGTTANGYALVTSSTAAATVSGATMTGGVAGDTVVVDGNTFTCVATSPGGGQFATSSDLNTLVNAVSTVNSTLANGVISIVADAVGTSGNALALSVGGSNAGTLSVSGATLTGGVAQTYTEVIEIDDDGETEPEVDTVINISALTGSSPTLTVTPQTSLDKQTWIDRTASSALAAVAVTEMHVAQPLTYFRFKLVVGGTGSPTVTGTLNAASSRG